MSHFIFDLLDNVSLNDEHISRSRLLEMNPNEFLQVLDDYDKAISKPKSQEKEEAKKDETLWLPYPSTNSVQNSIAYLLLFDRVKLIDPLYDYLTFLSMENMEFVTMLNSFTKTLGLELSSKEFSKIVNDRAFVSFFEEFKTTLKEYCAEQAAKLIGSYYQNKQAINEGIIIPHINTGVSYDAKICLLFARLMIERTLPPNIQHLEPTTRREFIERLQLLRQAIRNNKVFPSLVEMYRFFLTTSVFKHIIPSQDSNQIDIGDSRNKATLDKMMKIGVDLLQEKIHIVEEIKWPEPYDEMFVPTITGIPSELLLEIRSKESDTIKKFRYDTKLRLTRLNHVLGTKDYSKLLSEIHLEQQAQVAELDLLVKHIRSEFMRKSVHHVSITFASASWAILSAIAVQNQPLAMLGLELGIGGTIAGVSSLLDNWISYERNLNSLKETDSYILWKLQREVEMKE